MKVTQNEVFTNFTDMQRYLQDNDQHVVVIRVWVSFSCGVSGSLHLNPSAGMLFEKLVVAQLVKKFTEVSLWSSPECAIGSYPQPDKSS
jgi:hypothetical protein